MVFSIYILIGLIIGFLFLVFCEYENKEDYFGVKLNIIDYISAFCVVVFWPIVCIVFLYLMVIEEGE